MFNSFKAASVSFAFLFTFLTTIASAQLFRPLDNLDAIYDYDVRGRSAKDVQALSIRQYQDFIALDINSQQFNPHFNRDDKKAQFMTKSTAEKALQAALYNPVVNLYMTQKYDPDNRGIGFCFGRAMFIDLYLSINNFNRGSIKKAFVVGPMRTGSSTWAWHVTTIVQSKDRSGKEIWLAIDPIMDKVMEITAWYKETLKLSTDGKLRLYITEAGKFAQIPTRYDYQTFNHPYYNNYFRDMLQWFEANDVDDDLNL
jgi:hypothetical protein